MAHLNELLISGASTAGGNLAAYGAYPLGGKVIKVSLTTHTNAANGSIWLYGSGTDETILYASAIPSGTAPITAHYYPRIRITDVSGASVTAVSGNVWEGVHTTEKLWLAASGLGDTKGASARVFWSKP